MNDTPVSPLYVSRKELASVDLGSSTGVGVGEESDVGAPVTVREKGAEQEVEREEGGERREEERV